jgi:hypothetical protein
MYGEKAVGSLESVRHDVSLKSWWKVLEMLSTDRRRPFALLLESDLRLLDSDITAIARGDECLLLPEPEDLCSLCGHVKELFLGEHLVLDVTSPVITVGNLHGHLLDLLRILQTCGVPPRSPRYLFLGDYVGHGEFSVPTIILLYLLKAVYPGTIFLVRGDDEFESFCEGNGFLRDLTVAYPEGGQLFQAFLQSFSCMPLAAVVGGGTICLHGGIGPMIESLDYLRKLRRPIVIYTEPVVSSIICSDPSHTTQNFATRSVFE